MNNQPEQILHNIFLIGFMGSGKTTVCGCLHKMYGMEVVEMDSMISKQEGMSISDIFTEHGEEYFRALVAELRDQNNIVVSCGGGTPMRENNVALMKKSGRIVLLTARPETIYERVRHSHDRPLLENNMNVPYIAELMEKRREKYEAAADLIVETDGKKAAAICGEIMQKITSQM